MPKFFVNENQIEENRITITGNDVNHIRNVLRMPVGKEVIICNLDTRLNYITKIEEITKEKIVCHIIDVLGQNAEPEVEIDIYQGIPKAEKMELIIQKSTELGAKKIIPVEMIRSIVKLDEKGKIKKQERWQKIAEVAAKQSGRDEIPEVEPILKIKEMKKRIKEYDAFIVAYENERNHTLKEEIKRISSKKTLKNPKIGVIIGPEGGISEEEIEILKEEGASIITLGKRILRTETVALVLTFILMYELDELQ